MTQHLTEFSDRGLDYNTSLKLRFLFIFMIILYHTAPVEVLPDCFGKYLFLFVAPFFFLSGYGLTYSFYNKPNYLSSMLPKRNKSLVIPLVVGILLLNLICFGLFFDANRLFVFPSGTFPFHWFILQLMFLYYVFYVAFTYCKTPKTALIVLFPLIIASMIVLSVLTSPFYRLHMIFYAQGTFGFYLGIIWYYAMMKKVKVDRRLLMGLFIGLTVFILIYDPFSYDFNGPRWESGIPQGLFQMVVRGAQYTAFLFVLGILQTRMLTNNKLFVPMCLLATIVYLAILVTYNVDLPYQYPAGALILLLGIIVLSDLSCISKVLMTGGMFSYELFIMHQPVFSIFNSFFESIGYGDTTVIFFINLILAFVLSYIVYRISSIVFRQLQKQAKEANRNTSRPN